MSMAQDYCNASIALDCANSNATWTRTPGISSRQRDAYLDQEVKTRDKMLSRYPHKYVAVKRGENKYDVKQVFVDGSELICLASTDMELELLRKDGEQVELIEEEAIK